MRPVWLRFDMEKVGNRERRLYAKLVAWLIVMFVMFEIGLQVGIANGRRMGRIEEKRATLEKYNQVVKDAGYYSEK